MQHKLSSVRNLYVFMQCVCTHQLRCATLTLKTFVFCLQQEPGLLSGGCCICWFHRRGCVDHQHALCPYPNPCHHTSSKDHRPTGQGLEQAEDSHRSASTDLMGIAQAGHIVLTADCSWPCEHQHLYSQCAVFKYKLVSTMSPLIWLSQKAGCYNSYYCVTTRMTMSRQRNRHDMNECR